MTDVVERRAAVEAGSYRVAGAERQQEFAAELRAARSVVGDKEFVSLRGYASTVDQPYRMFDMFGEYEEQIARSAFDKTLASNPDVNFLVNHTGLSMARTTNKTLRLSVDEHGLLSEADLNPQRNDVHDLEISVRDGNTDQMSFAFRIVDGSWNKDYTVYTINEVDLNRGDVSAVNYGANPNTSIAARMKQGIDVVDYLEGEPLRILAARAEAKLRDAQNSGGLVVTSGSLTVGPSTPVVTPAGPNKATLAALLALEEDN